jgi:hypothetical protein
MIIEWLLMGVLIVQQGGAPIQQTYATKAECEAGRKVWDALTPEMDAWVKSVCVKKVKT